MLNITFYTHSACVCLVFFLPNSQSDSPTTTVSGIAPVAYAKGNDKQLNLLSMPVRDLMNVSEDDFVLAFHAGWHRHLTFFDRLHVALRSQRCYYAAAEEARGLGDSNVRLFLCLSVRSSIACEIC